MITTEVCIIGAGPGGASAALKLHHLGIPCVLIDKATFPRDKICGDAVSGKVLTVLNRIDPNLLFKLDQKLFAKAIWGVKFVAPNSTEIDVAFTETQRKDSIDKSGYVAKRIDFDNFLIEEVKNCNKIQLIEGVKIENYQKTKNGFLLSSADNKTHIKTKILIDSSGAHSIFSRKYAGIKKDPKHYAGAVRAYYKNVSGFSEGNLIELHFLNEILPGYFWVFPLPNGYANVGIGLLTEEISKKKINLKTKLTEIIKHHPNFINRFKDSERIGKLEGFGLPFGSKVRKLSGDHYMLVGDAASLIDPLTGEGIGNAVFSGFIAAEQARDCLASNDFTTEFLKAYDKRIYRVMGQEFKISSFFQSIGRYPRLLNLAANITTKNKHIQSILSSAFIDVDLRGKLRSPIFWLKMIFNY